MAKGQDFSCSLVFFKKVLTNKCVYGIISLAFEYESVAQLDRATAF